MNLFEDPNDMALLAAGASLLEAGAPSMTPQGFGPAAGKAINAYMQVLPQAKKQAANKQFMQLFGNAQNIGGGPSAVRDPSGAMGGSLLDVIMGNPEMASAAMQSDYGPAVMQAALTRKPNTPEPFTLGEGQVRYGPDGQPIAAGPPKTAKPSYDERDIQLPGGMVQKQVSRDGGQNWEPIGEPWDRRDPWKPFTTVNQQTGEVEIGYVNTKSGERTTTGTKPPGNEEVKRDALVGEAIPSLRIVEDAFGIGKNGEITGEIDQGLVASMWARVPFSEGRRVRQAFRAAFTNMTYLKTGAQATTEEVANAEKTYLPSPLDSQEEQRQKLKSLRLFFTLSGSPGPATRGADDPATNVDDLLEKYAPNG